MIPHTAASADTPNHPLAVRMGILASICQNLVIGLTMGHFGIMLASIQQRLHVTTSQASVGMLFEIVGSALTAPFVGVLLAKRSLRALLTTGAVLTALGFFMLAFTTSYLVYLLAFLFFGFAMSLTGSIGPATLVTRWFSRNRGLALGLVNLPFAIAATPVILNRINEGPGPFVSYLVMALICTFVLIPAAAMTRDYPPGTEPVVHVAGEPHASDGAFTVPQLLARPLFWAVCLAAVASMTSSVLLGTLLVPMGISWGFTRGQSALIQSIMSTVGLLGSVLFGWTADRIGGGRNLALIGFDCAVLWLLLLAHPPFALAAVIVGLIGMHGAGAIPSIGRGLSDAFGPASFSRGFGINTMIALPFMAIALIGAPKAYEATGSYAPAIVAMAGYFAVAVFLGLYVWRGGRAAAARRKAAATPA